ncbi:B-cell receptor CD22-like [Xiphophorus maculatus]|uniref:B-cell receptor CD22-like n=1 Tax=Xiphophorus maculatus TaxID=8083 RepID=UPI000C6DC82B|nr:B-cell receptor CD22-like [Xiphophorus maculatus]
MSTLEMLLSLVFLPSILAVCERPGVSLTLPTPIEALSGSCFQVPCRFIEHNGFNSTGAREGVWIKHGKDIYTTAHGINKYPIEITGDLDKFNCSTLLSDVNTNLAGKYFLRLDNKQSTATACAHPLWVTVRDSPWSPSINLPSDLKEHQSVIVTCSAFTPCPHSPPKLTWNLQQDSLRQTEENTDGTFTTKIQETITLSDTHDGYNISCSARYPVIGGNKTAETKVTLSVSYAPRNTSASIRPSGLVSAGRRVELSCSSRAKPPPRFTWFRKCEHGTTNVSVGPVYSFAVTKGGEYYCVATNGLGNQRSPDIYLRIKETPGSPSIDLPSDLKEHQSVTVTCSAFTPCPHSPPKLTWNLQQDSLRQTEKNTDGTFTTKIQETITLSDTHDGYNIRCSAKYPVIGGIKTAETEETLSVSYAPRNTFASISPSGLVSAGSRVELSCFSRAKPPPSFTWFWKSKHGEVDVSVGPAYNLSVTEKGEYYCVASNNLGSQTSSVIHLNIEESRVSIYSTMTIVGLVMLCGAVIIFECWLRFSKKPAEDTNEAE